MDITSKIMLNNRLDTLENFAVYLQDTTRFIRTLIDDKNHPVSFDDMKNTDVIVNRLLQARIITDNLVENILARIPPDG